MDNPFRDFFVEMRDFMDRSKWQSYSYEDKDTEFIPDIYHPNQPERDQFQDIFSHFDNLFKSFGFPGSNFTDDYQLPSIEGVPNVTPQNPRDEMLKVPDSSQLVPSVPIEKFWYSPNLSTGEREDTDIDERVRESGLHNLDPVKPLKQDNTPKSYFKSISITRIQTSDGKVEERKTVKDSSGKVETSVRKILGDQSIETKTLQDQDGVQEKVENYVNMDEDSISDFLNKWRGEESKFTPKLSLPNIVDDNQPRSFVDLFKSILKFPTQK